MYGFYRQNPFFPPPTLQHLKGTGCLLKSGLTASLPLHPVRPQRGKGAFPVL